MPIGVMSMAFQMSTLVYRMKIPTSLSTLTISRGVSSGKVFNPISNFYLNRSGKAANRMATTVLNLGSCKQSWSALTRRLNAGNPIRHFGVIESRRSAVKFSTSSVSLQTGIGWVLSCKRVRSIGQGCVLLGALGISTVVASLHMTSLRAMASVSDTINLDSADTDWKEVKNVLISATLEKRRASYRTSDFLSLDQIPIWAPSGPPATKTLFEPNETLNPKISLFRGDITKLEIDAIVNAANKTLLGGGGVDGSIHRGAGPLLKKECATLGGCETGEAKITGAYGLPAKYVIHTVGPIASGSVGERERADLRSCYQNCLELAAENGLRTVAFPCISTGVYGYPPEKAVEVALATVREYLEQHHTQLDRVIFCVFLKSDEDLYLQRLPQYFPHAG